VTGKAGALEQVLREADAAAVDALPTVVSRALANVGVRAAVVYLLDYDVSLLLPAPGSLSLMASPEPQPLEDSLAGRACTHQELVETIEDGVHTVWVPISQRFDCLGVLQLELDRLDDDLRGLCCDVGILLGHLLSTAHEYTDVYELLSRRRDMNLAAEMHWEVQPAMSYAGPRVRIAGGIEPAYEVGGDTFDYNINGDIVDFALLDAMGHGLEAALLSFQAVAAYRYGRRRRQSLAEIAATLEDTFVRQFGGDRFVTGILCRLDLRTGALGWVNAAHQPPLLLRDGRLLGELGGSPACPLGLALESDLEVHEATIEPGDSIVLYSDGVVEARSPSGDDFELDRLRTFLEHEAAQKAPPSTAVRHILEEIKAHSSGPLHDDATLVQFDYVKH
jgi:serine phosphatase RsbU (regulator of sigma subunit)